jgi:predicted membrane-bound mannosyltransferase
VYPWWFYLKRLCWWHVERGPTWSEGPLLLLATVGVLVAICKRPPPHGSEVEDGGRIHFLRWIAVYGLAVTAIYGLIPYKTPWCLTQFLIALLVLAGIGGAWLLALRPWWWKANIAVSLAASVVYLGWQAHRASVLFSADPGNPYVLSQTSLDVERLAEHVTGVAEVSPHGWKTPVKVIWTDVYYWPLPWYLRRFGHVELWRQMPGDPVAPLVVAAPQYNAQLEKSLGRDYVMLVYELRPQVLMQLWVQYELWEAYLRRIGKID